MIEVIDNFLTQEEFYFVIQYCNSALYGYGEADDINRPPVGLVHNIPTNEKIYELFVQKTKKFASEHSLYRMYINCFAPSENPFFHTDSADVSIDDEITFLYYVNESWDIDDCGETQFFIDDRIYGVAPIPNRLVYFNANILHRATSLRDRHRFTIALKYKMD
jgi:Rps23 Pro-64 3,4-dihydroxylase Tpa1-like proline 4-hydroxylase